MIEMTAEVRDAVEEGMRAGPVKAPPPTNPDSGKGRGSVRASAVVWWSEDRKHRLTLKQKRFCDAYLARGMVNATAAARDAGMEAKNDVYLARQAHDLLKSVNVRAYLELMRPKHEASLLVSRDYVVEKLKEIAEGSKNDNARVSALKHIGQYLGMWVERTELTGKDGGPVGFADQTQDLSGIPEENLKRVKELLSARKRTEEAN